MLGSESAPAECFRTPPGPRPAGAPPHPALTPGTRWPHLVVLPGDHAGLLSQGWLLGGPAVGGSAGLARLPFARCPHRHGQRVVLLPKLPQPHALRLQRLLQLQDPNLQPHAAQQARGLSPGSPPPSRAQPRGGTGPEVPGHPGSREAAGSAWAPTWVSISCFFSLMRDMPEKSMVSVARGGVSVCAPPSPRHSWAPGGHLCLRSALGPTWWRPPRWRPSR